LSFLEYTSCPITTFYAKQTQFSRFLGQKRLFSEKTNPNKPNLVSAKSRRFRRDEDGFYPPRADLVAAFGHAMYSMAKIMGEK